MIAGVELQDSGEIYVDGKLVCDTVFRVPPERRSIGLMFQDFALFPHLSVGENVAFGLKGAGSERKARARALLDRVGLVHYIDEYPHQLSGGEQQRVAVARALATRPALVLADEPTGNLDEATADVVLTEFLRLVREEGSAAFVATHNERLAAKMDRIVRLHEGYLG